MNKTNFLHAFYALLMQFIGWVATGSFWPGCVFAIGFFIAREHAQRQVDIRSETGEQVPNQNPFMGFLGWSKDSYLDALFPWVTLILAVRYG